MRKKRKKDPEVNVSIIWKGSVEDPKFNKRYNKKENRETPPHVCLRDLIEDRVIKR